MNTVISDREHALVLTLRETVGPVEFRLDTATAFTYSTDDKRLIVSPALLAEPAAGIDDDLFPLYVKAVAVWLRIYALFAEHPAIADRALEYTSATIDTWISELQRCNDLLQ